MKSYKYSIFGDFIDNIRLGVLRRKWHKLHPDSDTIPMNSFDFSHISVGEYTYGELNIIDFGGDCKLILKNYVSIAQQVTFLLNAEHHLDHISTYPFKVKILGTEKSESFGKGNIVVDDDVWIGYGATIMSGVHIGQGAVVASGAVVCKDVPPYAIVGGNPARVIRKRFSDDIISKLLTIDYDKLNICSVSNVESLYKTILSSDDIEDSFCRLNNI